MPLEPLAKIGVYSALLALLGAHVARWLVLPLRSAAPDRRGFDRRAAALAVAAAGTLALFMVARLAAHSVATFGPTEGLQWDNLVLIGVRSRWGRSWRLQFLAALIALSAARWASRAAGQRRSAPLLVSTATAFVAAGTFPLLGHAAGSPARFAFDAMHLMAAGAWLGTLGVLVWLRTDGPLFGRFSPVAMVGSTLAAATGASLAWMYVGSVANLWATPYGRLLSAKLLLVGGTALCGFVNWQSLRRDDAPPLARLEALLALCVVVATAFLTETEHALVP